MMLLFFVLVQVLLIENILWLGDPEYATFTALIKILLAPTFSF